MKLKRLALLFLVSAVTGWTGYYVGAMREPSAIHMPRGATVGLDYLVAEKSFSEVEHARAVLEALAARYVENAQGLIAQELMSRTANFGIEPSRSERPIVAAIKMLDEAIPEFRGTGVELRLLEPLLYALKQEGFYDRWLDVYLDALYRHPTDEGVMSLAEEAVAISQGVGRERELTAGLRYVSGIPADFLTESRIEHRLGRANARITGKSYVCQL
jgi:GNAT superfamily N-acetyltransferase